MSCNGYELKITPEKEKHTAQISIILLSSTWAELNSIYISIIKSISQDEIINREIFHNNTFFIEVKYEFLESITQRLENILSFESSLELKKRQIFIKKLGGWFDF